MGAQPYATLFIRSPPALIIAAESKGSVFMINWCSSWLFETAGNSCSGTSGLPRWSQWDISCKVLNVTFKLLTALAKGVGAKFLAEVSGEGKEPCCKQET